MNPSHPHKHHNLPGEHAITDIGQLILFVIFILVMIFDIFIFKFSHKIIGILSQAITFPLFLLFFLIGVYFIFTSHQIIFGKNDKEVGIVTNNGVFKMVRHPMYFGSILLFFSFVILSNSILTFLVWIVICVFYYFISRHEEKLLINKYGDKYKEYQKRVPMFIPFLK